MTQSQYKTTQSFMRDLLEYLKQNAVLSENHVRELHLKKKDLIITPASRKSDSVFIIKEGVAFFEVIQDHQARVVSFYSDWTLFHSKPIFADYKSFEINFPHQIRAATNMTIYQIDRDFLIDHLYSQPKFFHFLTEACLASVTISILMSSLSRLPPLENLSVNLEILALLIGKENDSTYTLPAAISQSVLASLCNCSQSAISAQINFLVEQDILASSSKPFIIKDIHRLQDYYDSNFDIGQFRTAN
ncbi:hypothetical protein MFLO_00295 [Listeria floridensis FSL S10-1187]|uniref:Crp/Fnr family transcriptional regulator n=1 Tax=Listeria floridensis FSL S10-1187 TaxID=1265817 RepID=A0ABN0RI49_9LIST|nr:Crp/Fnr family transcriptional regulator [Listeria floridensis]EUJ33647.1 hypothetical protein MFLO_00295 [Listeria floridensis FSL S10-1187]